MMTYAVIVLTFCCVIFIFYLRWFEAWQKLKQISGV